MIKWEDISTPKVIEWHEAIDTIVPVVVIRNGKGKYTIIIDSHKIETPTNILETAKSLAKNRYVGYLRHALLKAMN